MANLGQTFNTADLPESENNFEPVPAGWYTAGITNAELKQTKSSTGEYIAIRYDITGPTHQGRVIFANLNIRNANPAAENIGRQQLGELMRAIGLASLTDTDQLVGHSVTIKLGIEEGKDGYDARNKVVNWKAGNGSAPAVQTNPAIGNRPVAPKSAPPWAK